MMGGWSEGGEWGLYVRKQMVQRVDDCGGGGGGGGVLMAKTRS